VTKSWRSIAGNIRICDMVDSHLLNTIRVLKSRAEKRAEDSEMDEWQDRVDDIYWDME